MTLSSGNGETSVIDAASVHAALTDGHITCTAKETDYNLFKFVLYGLRCEPTPEGQTERTLEVFAQYAKDTTLRSICQRLIDAGETYDKLLVRYYGHLDACIVCKVHGD
jgi:hypothetical protein